MAEAAGVGTGGVSPWFVAAMGETETRIPLMPLFRAAIDELGDRGELAGAAGGGDVLASRSLEFAQYALGEGIVPICRDLDAALSFVPDEVALVGRGSFTLAKDDWPGLLAFIDARLAEANARKAGSVADDLSETRSQLEFIAEAHTRIPPGDSEALRRSTNEREEFEAILRSLEAKAAELASEAQPIGETGRLRDEATVERARQTLSGSYDELGAMALSILAHAVRSDLSEITVVESEPSRSAEDPWAVALDGSAALSSHRLSADVDTLLAKGMASRFCAAGARDREDVQHPSSFSSERFPSRLFKGVSWLRGSPRTKTPSQ